MKNPFIAGNWVRGEAFFGRRKMLGEILDGSHSYLWITGTRRMGKTSLLKQIEYLSSQGEYATRFVSLFWNMQGAGDLEGLTESLLESIEDAGERFLPLGIAVDDLEDKSLVEILRTLLKSARQHNRTLLLLCDECEELIAVEKQNPEVMPRLRRIFQQGENIRTIICATKRLMRLEESATPDTSPFLHGFIPPLYLGCFWEDDARALIRQGQFDEPAAAEILQRTNRHPYLVQLLCKRLFESGDLETVIQDISNDDMVSHFFAVDFDYLDNNEKLIIWFVLEQAHITSGELAHKTAIQQENLAKSLHSLIQLGYLCSDGERICIANYFFEKWLRREKEELFKDSVYRNAAVPARGLNLPSPDLEQNTLPGKMMSHYQILEELGRGGMGTVFKARDIRLERTVALKTLSFEMLREAEFRKRFFLEARAASALNHPNIATIYEIDEAHGIPFIVMEFIDGPTLSEWNRQGAATLPEKLALALQIARGLDCAHQNNIIHRDIKPDNIMIDRSGIAKLTDFGLAKILKEKDSKLTRTGSTMGTLAYMSPEQVAGLEADHRADIYSLGMVFYEMFTDRLPYTATNEAAYIYAIVHEIPPKAGSLKPDISPELEAMLAKMLEKERKQRYPSLESVIKELNVLLADQA